MIPADIMPRDGSPRLPKETRVYEKLQELNIPFLRVDHPAAFTMEDCLAPQAALSVDICKNLLLCNRQQTAFYLLMLSAQKPFVTRLLSPQIGSSRLSFASPENMLALLNITPGSMSPLGLMYDTEHRVQLLVDEDLLKNPYIGVHPCINTSTLKLSTQDLFERFVPSTGHDMRTVTLPAEG